MKARRAARELALLAFSQLCKDIKKDHKIDLTDIITMSVRALVDDAESALNDSLQGFLSMKEKVEEAEIDHPENLKRPIDAGIVPVPLTMTSDMIGRVDQAIEGIDKTLAALELAEVAALYNHKDVIDFSVKLVSLYIDNAAKVDEQIQKFAIGWNIDRLIRIDKDILRLAIVELLFVDDMPLSVTIDEAVELAKKYSTEESSSFINGILRGVVEENNLLVSKKHQ